MNKRLLFIFAIACFLYSCATVAPYKRQYLNDSDMQTGTEFGSTMDYNVQSYREGASGGNGINTGGGCGCN